MKYTLTKMFLVALSFTSAFLLANEPIDGVEIYGQRLFASEIGKSDIQVEVVIANAPAAIDFDKFTVTISLVTLPFGQSIERFDHIGGGVFRISIPKVYNYQQGWLKIGGIFYGEVILSNHLRIDIDGAQVKPNSKYKTSGVLFSGPDGNLSRLANEFISFRRKEQLDLKHRMIDVTRSKLDLEELSGRMLSLKDEYAQIARDFDPVYYEEWAKQEIAGEHLTKLFMALLQDRNPSLQRLEELPFWEELNRFEPLAATNSQIRVIEYLGRYARKISLGHAQSDATDVLCDIVIRVSDLPWNAQKKRENSELLDLIHARENKQIFDSARFAELLKQSVDEGLAHDKLSAALLANPELREILPAGVYELSLISKLRTSPEALFVQAVILKEKVENSKYVEFLTYLEKKALLDGQANADKLREIKHTSLAPLSETTGQDIQLHEFPDLDGEQLYDQIRASFPNRSLVLDFWGPWCPPCMNDLPYGKILQERLESQPITFIYFGCRTPRQAWEEAILQNNIKGIHILLTENQNAELMKRFGGIGYPTLRFVDQHGVEHRDALQRYKGANPSVLIRLAKR